MQNLSLSAGRREVSTNQGASLKFRVKLEQNKGGKKGKHCFFCVCFLFSFTSATLKEEEIEKWRKRVRNLRLIEDRKKKRKTRGREQKREGRGREEKKEEFQNFRFWA